VRCQRIVANGQAKLVGEIGQVIHHRCGAEHEDPMPGKPRGDVLVPPGARVSEPVGLVDDHQPAGVPRKHSPAGTLMRPCDDVDAEPGCDAGPLLPKGSRNQADGAATRTIERLRGRERHVGLSGPHRVRHQAAAVPFQRREGATEPSALPGPEPARRLHGCLGRRQTSRERGRHRRGRGARARMPRRGERLGDGRQRLSDDRRRRRERPRAQFGRGPTARDGGR
jgi:hypothetical protein